MTTRLNKKTQRQRKKRDTELRSKDNKSHEPANLETNKQKEKQQTNKKQRQQEPQTCMAASLDTPPAGALRAGDSPALGGRAADIIFTSFFLLFLLLYYSSFSSLFFFFILGLNHLKFLLTNLIVFIAITTFGAASSLF